MRWWEEFIDRPGIARFSRHASLVIAALAFGRLTRLFVVDNGSMLSMIVLTFLDGVEVIAVGVVSVMFMWTLLRELFNFLRSDDASHLVALGL